jgi:hypothetical protein
MEHKEVNMSIPGMDEVEQPPLPMSVKEITAMAQSMYMELKLSTGSYMEQVAVVNILTTLMNYGASLG